MDWGPPGPIEQKEPLALMGRSLQHLPDRHRG